MCKKIIYHNIVYSAKGGCGKTTFSTLFRILKFNEQFEEDIPEETKDFNRGPLVLMDLDLLASNLGDYETEFIEKKDDEREFRLIDCILSDKKFEYVENCKIKNNNSTKFTTKEKNEFMLIVAPKDENERSWFKSKRRYVPVVKFDEFKNGLAAFIKRIGRYLETSEHNSMNIIYDLPPNSDGYTEILFDLLLNKEKKIKDKDIKVEHKFRLFVLTNIDGTLIKVNLAWLNNTLKESSSNEVPDTIYFILNNYHNKLNIKDMNGEKNAKQSTDFMGNNNIGIPDVDGIVDNFVKFNNKVGVRYAFFPDVFEFFKSDGQYVELTNIDFNKYFNYKGEKSE